MLDINLLRTNPEVVKVIIKKKFQNQKLELVDKVVELDRQFRKAKTDGDSLRGQRNAISKQIGGFMKQGLKDKAEEAKKEVANIAKQLADLEVKEEEKETTASLIRGVLAKLHTAGYPVAGFDMYVTSTVLPGSGLSSSASVEVLTGFILRDMFGVDVTNQDLALIGQYSENNFNGMN